MAEPTGEAWLIQLQTAAAAGSAPADVSMMAQVARLKGESAGLWAPLDEAKLPNIKNLEPHFVQRYPDGRISSIGAVSWYVTLVTNTDEFETAPDSWQALWDPANEGKVGLMALPSNSFLLEITAKTWLGGTDVLGTDEGIQKAFEKLAEVRPNVALWWRDEGQFQQALQAGEVPMGEYYHDVTGLAASKGEPVRSTFPKEGGVLDSGSWVRRQDVAGAGGGADFHQLHVPPGHPGEALAQGRHGTHRAARSARPYARRVRGRRQRHPADHPALRSLCHEVRLAEPEVDRADRRLSCAIRLDRREWNGTRPAIVRAGRSRRWRRHEALAGR